MNNRSIKIDIINDDKGFHLYTQKPSELSWAEVIGLMEIAKRDILEDIRADKI